MKVKPRALTWIATVLIAVAAMLPIQIMVLYGHSPLELGPIAAKLAPLNWAILFLAPLAAWLVWRASPYALVAVPTLCVLVAQNNWLVAEMSEDFTPSTAAFGTVAFLAAMSPLATQQLRDLFLNPERRWWFAASRRSLETPVVLSDEGRELVATTFDISESGLYVSIPERFKADLAPGQVLGLSLDIAREGVTTRVSCLAEVVRLSSATSRHPKGMGMKFIDMPIPMRRAIAEFSA